MLIPNAFPLSCGGNADTTIAMEVTLIKDSDIPKIKRHAKNCSADVTSTLAIETIIKRIMLSIVIFLRPYFAEICPAGTDITATTSKKMIVTQFCTILLMWNSAAIVGMTTITAFTAKTVKNDNTEQIRRIRFLVSIKNNISNWNIIKLFEKLF